MIVDEQTASVIALALARRQPITPRLCAQMETRADLARCGGNYCAGRKLNVGSGWHDHDRPHGSLKETIDEFL